MDSGLHVAFLYIGGSMYFKQCLTYGKEYLIHCYYYHKDKQFLSFVLRHTAKMVTRKILFIMNQNEATRSKTMYLLSKMSSFSILLIGIQVYYRLSIFLVASPRRVSYKASYSETHFLPRGLWNWPSLPVANRWWPCVVRQDMEDVYM